MITLSGPDAHARSRVASAILTIAVVLAVAWSAPTLVQAQASPEPADATTVKPGASLREETPEGDSTGDVPQGDHLTPESSLRRGQRQRRRDATVDLGDEVRISEVQSTPLPEERVDDGEVETDYRWLRFSLFLGLTLPDSLTFCADVGRISDDCDPYPTNAGWHLGLHASAHRRVFRELLFVGGGIDLAYSGMFVDDPYYESSSYDGTRVPLQMLRPSFLAEVEYHPLPMLMIMLGLGVSVDAVVNGETVIFELDDRAESVEVDQLAHARFDMTFGVGRRRQLLARLSIGVVRTFSLGTRF